MSGAMVPDTAQSAPRPHRTPVDCTAVSVPMTLASGSAVHVGGRLCRPAPANGTVQVLLSGGTYDARYWTLPPVPGQASYVASQNARRFTTLTVDRLGTGASSRPPADAVTYDEDVNSVHAMVGALRAGAFGPAYARIFLVGHSYGSGEALGEASKYDDVTGVVLSGFAHAAGPKANDLLAALVPADTDPVTAPSNPPSGYLTTDAGSRASLFYNTEDASPATIAADEATKSTLTTGEENTLAAPYAAGIAAALKVPALLAVGGDDVLTCGGPYLACSSSSEILAFERQIFTGDEPLDAYILPGSGHSMNLAANASQWYAAAAGWIAQAGASTGTS
jgi:pimeloyl-ACP methyl ester carboxylesterase